MPVGLRMDIMNQTNIKLRKNYNGQEAASQLEFNDFLAIVIATMCNPAPAIHPYWSENNLYRNEFVSNLMTRDYFLELFHCFAFTEDNC